MRRVYFGTTSNGKTRQCISLAEQFKAQELHVVSNIPNISTDKRQVVDNNKERRICEYNGVLKNIYNGLSLKDYPFYNYTPSAINCIQEVMKYMSYKGDVLILDDIDSQIPDLVLGDIIRCLGEDGNMLDCWKHVIVSGYKWYLTYLMSNIEKESIFFVKKNNYILEVKGRSAIENEYARIVYE